MAKKFSYKGKSLEELQALSLEEFAKIAPSKARRTLNRSSRQITKFLEKFRKKARNPQKPLRTHFREMVVLPEMVGSRIQVYNGNLFVDVNVSQEMLSHRLGEYAITIKQVRHSGPGIGATRGSKSVELK